MATYSEKLKDPRWQKKRLEILSRDGFMCKKCCNDKLTLNVHHRYYNNGFEPWEYPDECYVTLCNDCHEFEHSNRRNCESNLIQTLKEVGAEYWQLQLISQALYNARSAKIFIKEIDHLLSSDDYFNHTNPIPQELSKPISYAK